MLEKFDPPKPSGRKHAPARPILNGLIYHFRTGCQWNQIPKIYGDDSTIHRSFQRWVEIGLFEMIWSLLLVDGQGGPLAIIVAPANLNDHLLLAETIEAIVAQRPEPTDQEPQNLCLDAGYDNEPSREIVKEHNYRRHIRPARGDKSDQKVDQKYPPRYWVVERTLGWLSKCRGLLLRYEKKSENYLGLLQFACALY